MISLLQNSASPTVNDVVVTVSELKEGTGSLYLFAFTGNSENESAYCLAYDSASLNSRYNRFSITVANTTASLQPYNATIFLTSGRGSYAIYEATSASLDPTGLNIVEAGEYVLTGSYTPRN
jgi:hypothetical protein